MFIYGICYYNIMIDDVQPSDCNINTTTSSTRWTTNGEITMLDYKYEKMLKLIEGFDTRLQNIENEITYLKSGLVKTLGTANAIMRALGYDDLKYSDNNLCESADFIKS